MKKVIISLTASIFCLSCVTQNKHPILLFNPKDTTQLWENMPTPISDFTITPYQAYCIVWNNHDFCQLSRKVIWACHYDENYYYISDAFFRVNKGKRIKNMSRWVDGRTGEIVLPSGKQKSLCGKIYSNIEDISELKHYQKYCGGWGIDEENTGIEYYKDNNENVVCVITKLLQHDENGKPIRKILDTVNIGKLKVGEILTYGDCRQDTIWSPEIIAVVIAEDKEVFDKIVKAWRVDKKTGSAKPIECFEGIWCINEGYGEREENIKSQLTTFILTKEGNR